MPHYRDEAVVLRTHKLGETDRIVTMLGRKTGQIRAVAKGVRKTSSRYGARLEPFMAVDAQIFEGKNLDVIAQVETIGSYGGEIVADYEKYTAACVMVETAERITKETSSESHYLLLLGGLRSLARGEHSPRLILDSYLLRALSLAGWSPSFDNCAICSKPGNHTKFLAQLGGTVCEECSPPGALNLGADSIALLIALLEGDWVIADNAERSQRAVVSAVVESFLSWQLERGLKSMRLLEKL